MIIKTRHHGEAEISDDLIIDFANGLPGFDEDKRFVVINDEELGMFKLLQSIDDSEVCFFIIDGPVVFPEYNPLVEIEEMTELGEYEPNDFSIYNIVKIPADMKASTANLKAPIVINNNAKKGKQIVCTNEEYTLRHPLFAEQG
ncbi:flagellar assembly factor FliW [Clostridia bacterium]|nr:flagellar assembly factor FliW [Clostridia bacterium]